MAVYLGRDKVSPYGGVKVELVGDNGEYNVEVVENEDGTQTLNVTDWDYIPTPDRTFANNSPALISAVSNQISKNGYTSSQVAEIYGWKLGDKIPITLTSGEKIEMMIIGVNHDYLSSDHYSKAGLTLQMVNLLATKYKMNDLNYSSNSGGYAACTMKTKVLPTYYEMLPQEWKDVIKLVDKRSDKNSVVAQINTTSENIFLFSMIEIYGTSLFNYGINKDKEGTQYEYFLDNTAVSSKYLKSIKNYDADGDGVPETAAYWWLRTRYSTGMFCYVSTNGGGSYTAANHQQRICFGFCV